MKKLLIAGLISLVFILTSCNGETIIDEVIEFNIINGIDTIEVNTEWVDEGFELTNGTFSFKEYTSDIVDTSVLGLYTLDYSAIYNEISYTGTRYVIVTDQTPPEIELSLSVDTVITNTEWIDNGVIITDNSLEVLSYTTVGTVDTTTTGVYEIIYTAIDSTGNSTSISRYVTVID